MIVRGRSSKSFSASKMRDRRGDRKSHRRPLPARRLPSCTRLQQLRSAKRSAAVLNRKNDSDPFSFGATTIRSAWRDTSSSARILPKFSTHVGRHASGRMGSSSRVCVARIRSISFQSSPRIRRILSWASAIDVHRPGRPTPPKWSSKPPAMNTSGMPARTASNG